VSVVRGGQPGPDVEELADADLTGQIADHAREKLPVLAHPGANARPARQNPVCDLPVSGEVVLTAQEVVVGSGRMRP
jgi:hypothetical protein